MSQNPINLIVRFVLEIVILVALAMWGAAQMAGWKGVLLAIVLPIIAAAIWGTFRTHGDHGHGLIETPGRARLLIEMALFILAGWALYDLGHPKFALGFGAGVVFHYLLSYDRVWFLLSK